MTTSANKKEGAIPLSEEKILTISKQGRGADAKVISKFLNYVAHSGNVSAAVRKFHDVSLEAARRWIYRYNLLAAPSETIKVRRHKWRPQEVRAQAVAMYNENVKVEDIAKNFGVSTFTIYSWIKSTKNKKKFKSKNKMHPAVSKVIEDIRNEQSSGETYSLASDFGISANTDTRETGTPVELKFCPCCGTNIKAVLIALQACKELR